MTKDLTQLKQQEDYIWLKDASDSALQQSLKDLEKALKNFFAHRAKNPWFKSRHKRQSLRYPASCSIKGNGIQLPKLGIVKAVIPRKISGEIKSVTISRDSTDKYFAAILFETGETAPTSKEGKISGIDLGLTNAVTVFDGETSYKVDPILTTKKYAK